MYLLSTLNLYDQTTTDFAACSSNIKNSALVWATGKSIEIFLHLYLYPVELWLVSQPALCQNYASFSPAPRSSFLFGAEAELPAKVETKHFIFDFYLTAV